MYLKNESLQKNLHEPDENISSTHQNTSLEKKKAIVGMTIFLSFLLSI
jgi:hypothetical protein